MSLEGSSAVVLVSEDCVACTVFSGIQHGTIASSKLTTVPSPHSLFLCPDRRLLTLQPLSFPGRQRAGVDALLNTLLLISSTLVNSNAWGRTGDLRPCRRPDKETETCYRNKSLIHL
jgi:hypothetical protein